jgi:hypothetical protein
MHFTVNQALTNIHKGYVNQRTVRSRRAHLIEQLYADPVPPGAIVAR